MAIKHIGLSALAFTFALAQAPVAVACHGVNKKDWVEHISHKLDLSTEQKVKVKLYTHKTKMELRLKHHDLKEIHKRINESFLNGDITEAKIDEFAGQEERVHGAIAKIRLHERYDVYSVLTEPQKAKMNKMIQDWEMKHHKDKKNKDKDKD
ncbi:MAG: Spy/CpxP family protein refolding chaperone [Gammaproteobacteria bacterium]|nr:Spy/CpxP family protein refolding chaperone [Gammaproteobacteria bacterium]